MPAVEDTRHRRGESLFAGVDIALFTTTFGRRLRAAGMRVPLTALERAASAHALHDSGRLDDLYWTLRLSLVHDVTEIDTFDRVFDAVFSTDTSLLRDKNRDRSTPPLPRDGEWARLPHVSTGDESSAEGLPWITLPSVSQDPPDDTGGSDDLAIPERRPSLASLDLDTPFDALDDAELSTVEALLDDALREWPSRPSRRRTTSSTGAVSLRHSLRRARRSGGEIAHLVRTSRTERPRRVVALLDVSASMESYTRAYLHLIRPLAQRHQAEVFAIGTTLTRITPAVRKRTPEETIVGLTDAVDDRFAGTRLASSLTTLLRHHMWSTTVRGAVVLVCSDGWDADPPAELERAMARLARSSHRIVWVNPRSSALGFEPRTAGMAAARPFCDEFLPGHSMRTIQDVIAAVSRA